VEVGVRGMYGVGKGAKRAYREGAVDSQHGTGLEGSSHSCTPSKGILFLFVKHVPIILCICRKCLFVVLFIFFSSAG
jgi:hypothetical protein